MRDISTRLCAILPEDMEEWNLFSSPWNTVTDYKVAAEAETDSIHEEDERVG